jgi:hypothetical protein
VAVEAEAEGDDLRQQRRRWQPSRSRFGGGGCCDGSRGMAVVAAVQVRRLTARGWSHHHEPNLSPGV